MVKDDKKISQLDMQKMIAEEMHSLLEKNRPEIIKRVQAKLRAAGKSGKKLS